jgi:hypothetical protein
MTTRGFDATTNRLTALCLLYLRQPAEAWADLDTGTANVTFTPPLTAAEQAILDDLALMAKFGITADLSLAEFRAIKPDLVTARQYVGLASPTAAQTTAALKSAIRVLGALLRS